MKCKHTIRKKQTTLRKKQNLWGKIIKKIVEIITFEFEKNSSKKKTKPFGKKKTMPQKAVQKKKRTTVEKKKNIL